MCPKYNKPIKYNAFGVSMGGCEDCRREMVSRKGTPATQFLTRLFDGHDDLFEWIVTTAAAQVRTPHQQVIYLLKTAMRQKLAAGPQTAS